MTNAEWVSNQGWKFVDIDIKQAPGGEYWSVTYTDGQRSMPCQREIGKIKEEAYDLSGWRVLLRWLDQEHKEPILTEEERKYLSAVIKPWRESLVYITKQFEFCRMQERIVFIK